MGYTCIPDALADQARQQPDAPAYTFVDYDIDPAGQAQTLTWRQVHERARIVAAELASCGSPGDRAAILAPQGLEYVIALLGAMEAGFIAVPLSVPMLGAHDERVSSALKDSAPTAILTTSAAAGDVDACVRSLPGPPPAVIEIDALDLYGAPAGRSGSTPQTKSALLQYTSGSTRAPAGVEVTHRNVMTNLEQIMSDYFEDRGGIPPRDATLVSWLPFYHDMGLMFGIFIPVRFGLHAVLTSPIAFLQKPARWIRLVAGASKAVTPAPNFAYELAARRTSDEDMAGLDLGDVHTFISGAERVNPATFTRFLERFSRFNLPATGLRAAYGLAEATVYVTTSNPGRPAPIIRLDYEKLSAGYAQRCGDEEVGSELVGHGTPRACTVRIVDPETCAENPAGKVGEIWVHGDNVASGYWRNPHLSEPTFGARLANPSPGTPEDRWLRSGDLGVIFEGELFIIGRIKDVLIVDGRNHYPDDIEATVQEITRSRVAAITVADERSERLVVISEHKARGGSPDEERDRVRGVKREVTSTVSKVHGLQVSDLMLVAPGSIPITTSGKVRRSACVENYRQDVFPRLDVDA
ncbi:AMP-binding protein [Mycobacterium helveticum]|uniref:AMP-binding protein n=1 Tax=Mycobacterium helveticum TaxID=2592811 RepID=A0A557XCW4_9MYCO|nr:AMP-binding protein [Mycobacterium helveticum]TVS83358.1 AMP-binding protein [Mycobacterium helveticum]TVS89591.1 AMP-binding protein [Mycobacterium helveticum]